MKIWEYQASFLIAKFWGWLLNVSKSRNRRRMRHKTPKEYSGQKKRHEKPTLSLAVMPCDVWKLSGNIVLVSAFQNFLVSCFINNLVYGSLNKVDLLWPQWSVVKLLANGFQYSFPCYDRTLPYVTWYMYNIF